MESCNNEQYGVLIPSCLYVFLYFTIIFLIGKMFLIILQCLKASPMFLKLLIPKAYFLGGLKLVAHFILTPEKVYVMYVCLSSVCVCLHTPRHHIYINI